MNGPADLERVYRYHDGTKHHFERFAQSLGYLDWASQPRPFRSFAGAPTFELFPSPDAPGAGVTPVGISYDQLFEAPGLRERPVSAAWIGHFLRHALGLSAWKVLQQSRWSLRVNPSSGNLHPTEAYLVTGPLADVDGHAAGAAAVWHYAPDRHLLERRCSFARDAWTAAGDLSDCFLVALTSIHWRESWKYGERAFRYCQHDVGHAVAAVAFAAALCGWRVQMLGDWPQRSVGALVGVDRDDDYVDAEREEPACLLLVGRRTDSGAPRVDRGMLEAVRQGDWSGRASQLSEDHVRWAIIDEVARATEDPGRDAGERTSAVGSTDVAAPAPDRDGIAAAPMILQRRSAVAFDGSSSTNRATFLRVLARTLPRTGAPWDALWWSPRIHLAIFAHRVDGLASGLYLFTRDPAAMPRLKNACRGEFLWEGVAAGLPLWLLQRGDCRALAQRLSCDQDIAADGFFSLAMIADFDRSLHDDGPAFYRHLFWESGVVGQVLYLEAEAAGARATGIGCFYDDPVHHVLGFQNHAFQSLYHFTLGVPIEDRRLTTETGYQWG